MGRKEEIVKEKLNKLNELKSKGINPYPYKFEVKNHSSEIKEKFKKIKTNAKTKNRVKIAGRIMVIRNLGKLIFSNLLDSEGKIQIILQNEETPKEYFDLFEKYVDFGDIVGIEGIVMKTKTGEISVLVKKLEILAKSILPLPEKWHGLTDKEERYRKRYLDLIMNPEVKEVFKKRTLILDSIREFLIF